MPELPAEECGTLTTREKDVLARVASGERSKEIAARLGVSPRTVDAHRASIMRKVGVHSVAELVRYHLRQDASAAARGGAASIPAHPPGDRGAVPLPEQDFPPSIPRND